MPRYTIEIPEKTAKKLEDFAKENGITKAETFRRAFSLFNVAKEEVNNGHVVGIIDKESNKVISRIIGIV